MKPRAKPRLFDIRLRGGRFKTIEAPSHAEAERMAYASFGVEVMKVKRGRPPKKWMADCAKGVREGKRKSGRVYSPEAVCGALWWRKMTPEQRAAAVLRHEPKQKKKT